MLFYKNVINGHLAGFTASPYVLNVKNFYEISKEEYLELGGYIEPEFDESSNSKQEEDTSSISQALIDALLN